jgi:hypothetical protein
MKCRLCHQFYQICKKASLDHLGRVHDESTTAPLLVSDETAVQDAFANDFVSPEEVISSDASPHELADTSLSLEEVALPNSPSAFVPRRSQSLKRKKAALEESIRQEFLALDRAVQEAADADGETPEAKRIRVNLMMNSDELLEELQLRDRKQRLRKALSRARSPEPVMISSPERTETKNAALASRVIADLAYGDEHPYLLVYCATKAGMEVDKTYLVNRKKQRTVVMDYEEALQHPDMKAAMAYEIETFRKINSL